jgi:hypothetical protein
VSGPISPLAAEIWFIWSIWFIWFVWFGGPEGQDRRDRPDRPMHQKDGFQYFAARGGNLVYLVSLVLFRLFGLSTKETR